jgi:hypothetical protein
MKARPSTALQTYPMAFSIDIYPQKMEKCYLRMPADKKRGIFSEQVNRQNYNTKSDQEQEWRAYPEFI